MKQGKKLLRRHKDYFKKLKIDCTNFLYERETVDEEGKTHLTIIDTKTNKTKEYTF